MEEVTALEMNPGDSVTIRCRTNSPDFPRSEGWKAGWQDFVVTVDASGRVLQSGYAAKGKGFLPRIGGIGTLSVSTLVEGPGASSAPCTQVSGIGCPITSAEVKVTGTWTATANAPWLHTTAAGTGNGLFLFSQPRQHCPHRYVHRRGRHSDHPAGSQWIHRYVDLSGELYQ